MKEQCAQNGNTIKAKGLAPNSTCQHLLLVVFAPLIHIPNFNILHMEITK